MLSGGLALSRPNEPPSETFTAEYFLSRCIFKNCMFFTKEVSLYCRTSELEDLLTKNVSKESVIFDGKVIKKSAMKDIDRLEPIGQILEADDSHAKQPVCSLNIIFYQR